MNRYRANNPLTEHQEQCPSSLCFHLVSEPWLSCYYGASLWLWQFVKETMRNKYLFHFSSMYGIKCFEDIYKQECRLDIFWMNSYDSMDCQNLWSCGLVSPKTILILSKNFLHIWFDTIEKQGIINLICQGKSYASIVIGHSEVTFLEEGENVAFFFHLSIAFWLYTVLQYRSSMSSNFLVFHTFGYIFSKPADFLFLIFVITTLSSSWVNCPSLMSSLF